MPGGNDVQAVATVALSEQRISQITLGVNIAQALLNLILLIITGVSVYYAFQAYYHQKERAKKDAACSLARYYAHDIIRRYDLVSYTFNQSGKEEKIKKLFAYDRLKEFNYKEMENLLIEKGLNPTETLRELEQFDLKIIYQGIIRNASSVEERHILSDEYIKVSKDKSGKQVFEIVHSDMLMYTFTSEVVMLLNDLEWFAMSCRYGLADEEMLYQSLHLTFLSSVWMLYKYICQNNKGNENKLFTNTIWLFNKWSERLRSIQKEAQEQAEHISQEIAIKERELEETRQKVHQVEPKVHTGKQLK